MNPSSIPDNLIEKKFITPKELGELLRISLPTIYRLINSRKIPAHKIGNSFRFFRDDVMNYLAGCRKEERKI